MNIKVSLLFFLISVFAFGQIHPKDEAYFKNISKEEGVRKIDSLIANSKEQDQLNLIYQKGMILSSVYSDFEMAIESYYDFLKINQDSASNSMAYLNIGKNFYRLNKLEESIKAIEKGLQLNPENPYLLFERGFVNPDNDSIQKGIKENFYLKAVEKMYEFKVDLKEPKFASMLTGNLGYNYYHQIEFEKSEKYLRQANLFDSTSIHHLNNYANTLQRLNKLEQSIEYYDKTLAIDSTYVYAINGKANSLFKLNRISEACENWNRALKLGYQFQEIWREQYAIENPEVLINNHSQSVY